MFFHGRLHPLLTAYEEYLAWSLSGVVTRGEDPCFDIVRQIDVRKLVEKLEDVYYFLFLRDILVDRPIFASHPLGTVIFHQMAGVVHNLDGVAMCALELYGTLQAEIKRCLRPYIKIRRGHIVEHLPAGWGRYITDVLEAALMNFPTHEAREVQSGVLVREGQARVL